MRGGAAVSRSVKRCPCATDAVMEREATPPAAPPSPSCLPCLASSPHAPVLLNSCQAAGQKYPLNALFFPPTPSCLHLPTLSPSHRSLCHSVGKPPLLTALLQPLPSQMFAVSYPRTHPLAPHCLCNTHSAMQQGSHARGHMKRMSRITAMMPLTFRSLHLRT